MGGVAQELFAAPYFCQEQSEEHFKLAQVTSLSPRGILNLNLKNMTTHLSIELAARHPVKRMPPVLSAMPLLLLGNRCQMGLRHGPGEPGRVLGFVTQV